MCLKYVVGVCPNKMATQAVTSLEITTFYVRYEVITEVITKHIDIIRNNYILC
jgi:hypothetical protein